MEKRVIWELTVEKDADFVDAWAGASITWINYHLSRRHGQRFDLSVLADTGRDARITTQRVAELVLDEGHAGLRYLSRQGMEGENWVIFEQAVHATCLVGKLADRTEAVEWAVGVLALNLEPSR